MKKWSKRIVFIVILGITSYGVWYGIGIYIRKEIIRLHSAIGRGVQKNLTYLSILPPEWIASPSEELLKEKDIPFSGFPFKWNFFMPKAKRKAVSKDRRGAFPDFKFLPEKQENKSFLGFTSYDIINSRVSFSWLSLFAPHPVTFDSEMEIGLLFPIGGEQRIHLKTTLGFEGIAVRSLSYKAQVGELKDPRTSTSYPLFTMDLSTKRKVEESLSKVTFEREGKSKIDSALLNQSKGDFPLINELKPFLKEWIPLEKESISKITLLKSTALPGEFPLILREKGDLKLGAYQLPYKLDIDIEAHKGKDFGTGIPLFIKINMGFSKEELIKFKQNLSAKLKEKAPLLEILFHTFFKEERDNFVLRFELGETLSCNGINFPYVPEIDSILKGVAHWLAKIPSGVNP